MGPHSNPAGSEANESIRFSDDCVSCGLLRDKRARKRHRSEGAVLRSGRTFRNVADGRAGLVQQTQGLCGHGGSDVQTGSSKRSGGVGRFDRGSCLPRLPKRSAMGAKAFSGSRDIPGRVEVILPS